MATTITAFTDIKGAKTRVVRGTVGTAIALVADVYEGIIRVTVTNYDATLANGVDLFIASRADDINAANRGGTNGTVGQGFQVLGSQSQNIYLRNGEVLTAKAAADRDIGFLFQIEGSVN